MYWSIGCYGPEFWDREVCAGVQGAVGQKVALERYVLEYRVLWPKKWR